MERQIDEKQFQVTSPGFPSLNCERGEVAALLFLCFKHAELRAWVGQELGSLYVRHDGLLVLSYIRNIIGDEQ